MGPENKEKTSIVTTGENVADGVVEMAGDGRAASVRFGFVEIEGGLGRVICARLPFSAKWPVPVKKSPGVHEKVFQESSRAIEQFNERNCRES
ncbi:MAG: hypothetical protein OXD29_08215, partial [Roseovarius sp.]|nr:hypothetical protein [Roseovarius sp.]